METIRKGYKQTDIGIIPEDWEVSKLSDIGFFYKGSGISKSDANSGYIPAIRYGELYTEYDNYILKCKTFISNDVAKNAAKTIKGDVLFAGSGETKEDIGKCATLLCDDECYAGGDIIILRPNSCNSLLLGFVLNAPYVRIQKAVKGQGDAVVHISTTSLQQLLVALPTEIAEQRTIAEVLSDIDSLIEVLNKKIAKKRAVKDGAMQQLLTAKKRLPGFSDPWVENNLGNLGVFISGDGFPLHRQGCQSGTYPFYKVSDFNNKGNESRLLKANNYISYEVAKLLSCKIIPTDSIVFAKIGAAIALERKKISSVSCCIDNNMMAFIPNICILAEYIWRIFQTIRFWDLTEATALPSLSSKQIGALSIKIPSSLKEQQAISEILTDMDDEIELLEQQRSKYTALKQGAMQQLLTGQIRLVANRQIRQTDKSQKQANVHFKRSVWAAEIADRLCNEPTFGHVKMEKMIFLTEHLCGVDIGSNYHRDAAGPYDNRAIRSIDSQLKKQNWFEASRNDKGYYQYIPLVKRGGHKEYFNKYFSDVQADFDKVIDVFRNWNTERCEIVATLYSAWKDIASAQKTYSDEDIINEVLNNWHESKKRISIERWQLALKWMKEKGFEPKL